MKTIYKIAKTEIKTLFYSPIAWLIMVIFAFQSAMVFTGIFESYVTRQSLGWKLFSATLMTFSGRSGLFTAAQQYLFLYIPLLTMGVMSREFSSGSIKLLFSSPVTSRQIVFGKYLALIFFALILTAILGAFSIYASATIIEVDIPVILTGLFGLFLLICAYSAIGLFMSSLTSYTVVSAMGTLAIFAVLNYVRNVGQEIEFVRDITYWLAISGRSDTFIAGMITSEDVLYFLVVIGLFLSFTIVKLQAGRQKSPWFFTFGKYASVFVIAMLIGYFSSMPRFMSYYDSTRTKVNTLTESSQKILNQLEGGLTINTYTNVLDKFKNVYIALPSMYKYDIDRFKDYLRFKPEIKVNHIYYYHDTDNPDLDKQYPGLNAKQRKDTLTKIYNWKFKINSYDDIKKDVDLASENFRFVRTLVRDNGKQTFLRVFDDMYHTPFESEISAAFKRLTLDELPTVGFLTGHGERASDAQEDRGYNMIAQEKTFRAAMINQGLDFQNVTLDKAIPGNIRILVIAEARKDFTAEEKANLDQYIQKGGNLIIAGEPGRQQYMNPLVEKIGVRFLPGMLVKPTDQYQSNLLILSPTDNAVKFSHHFDVMRKRRQVLTMPTTGALEFNTDKGFDVTTLFRSDTTDSWNELQTTDFIDDTVSFNPQLGEEKRSFPTAIALSRKIGGKEQRILVTGDADWMSNGELMMQRKDVQASNYSLISGAFFWLTNEEVPVDMRKDDAPDVSLRVKRLGWDISNIALKWVFPLLLALGGTLIWIRRKGR